MSLQLFAGGSGSGKSYRLYRKILKEARENPRNNYLIVVPEQFTLQTQKDIVALSPVLGILNIDVLSFNRLAYRVFEEVGFQNARGTLIDDMGKNLIIRRLIGQHVNEFPILGADISKIGCINEIKSVLSEFMQYGIGEREQKKLIDEAGERPLLQEKLKELHALYNIFNDFVKEKYITGEELLERVSDCIPDSKKLKSCVISFDGFTGFTPVQNKVIRALLENSQKVYVTVMIDNNARNNNDDIQEHELFYLSKKMMKELKKLAKEAGTEIEPDFFIDSEVPARYLTSLGTGGKEDRKNQETSGLQQSTQKVKNPRLIFLERNLFRNTSESYSGPDSEDLEVFFGTTREEEILETAIRIHDLIRKNNYRYHEIAVITGDINPYQHVCERVFSRYDIPFFIDRNIPILMNPFTEYIKASLDVLSDNFSYPAVMRYLRSGLTEFETDQIDCLDNYLIAFGIKGRSAFGKPFKKRKEIPEDIMEAINSLREKMVNGFSEFEEELISERNDAARKKDISVSDHFSVRKLCTALYHFIEKNDSAEKLVALADSLYEQGDESRGKEQEQIYQKVLELLDQLVELLGDEEVTIKEFSELMSAGFDEIRIGVVPKSQDYVQIGDITRSRLRKIKALFFVGVNDGIIPSSGGRGGLISDLDREFLTGNEEHIAMAPTKRQEAFTQRMYLYSMLTKPTEHLYVSYAELDENGESVKPSYVIKIISDMFPKTKNDPLGHRMERRIITEKSAILELSENIRTYIRSFEKKPEKREENLKIEYLALYQLFQYNNVLKTELKQMTEVAFAQGANSYQTQIDKAIAHVIYGRSVVGGITRLEQYAACAYSHFLSYGLHLRERDEFSFEARHLGNAFHDSLMYYGNILKEKGLNWTEISGADRENLVTEAIERAISSGDYSALYESSRSAYMKQRWKRLLNRSIDTLTEHLAKGSFLPLRYEFSFFSENDFKTFHISLSEDESVHLVGRIDRIDVCEDEEHIYVKVIDYKSGDENLALADVYTGLKLQLIVYLSAALELAKKNQSGEKEVLPAGTFYYHIDDPIVEAAAEEQKEEIEGRIRSELRMRGLTNSDERIYRLLDGELAKEGHNRSDVIPIRLKNDGTFYADSGVVSTADFSVLSEFSAWKLKELGKGILAGDISAARKEEDKSENCCAYCLYKTICGRNGSGPEEKRVPQAGSNEEVLSLMKEKLDEQG